MVMAYWRLARRCGKNGAAVAVGHGIRFAAFHMLRGHIDYHDLGGDWCVSRPR
jgi:hypothetical protein